MKMRLWSKIERKRRKYIRRYSAKIKRAMMELIKPVLQMLEYSNDLDALKAGIPALINTDRINEILIEMYGKVGGDFAANVGDFIKNRNKSMVMGAIKKNLEQDLWEQYMEQYAIREAGVQVVSINTYTKKEFLKTIQGQIDEGMKKGLGTNQIADNIKKKLPGAWRRGSTWKARRIAQTEVITASNASGFMAAEQTGYNMNKIWITAPIGVAETERHAVMGINEQKRGMNEPFDVGGVPMMMPGDPTGGAENVINCRCSLIYEVI